MGPCLAISQHYYLRGVYLKSNLHFLSEVFLFQPLPENVIYFSLLAPSNPPFESPLTAFGISETGGTDNPFFPNFEDSLNSFLFQLINSEL